MAKLKFYVPVYIFIFIGIHFLDAFTTFYLISNNLAFETNLLVDTNSLTTLIFSPAPALLTVFCIVSIAIAEQDGSSTAVWIRKHSLSSFLFSTPYFLLLAKVFAVINNTSIILGNNDFISWLSIFVGDDLHIGTLLLFIVSAMLVYPITTYYLKRRYPLPSDPTTNNND
jgi:hypothetical protein